MLYVAFVKNKPRAVFDNVEIMTKSRTWWNEGGKPAGIRTVAFYGALGSQTPDVYVFETDNHDDIRKMLDYWSEVDFDVHPAFDMAARFVQQGMKVT
jgi:hypothetical protein